MTRLRLALSGILAAVAGIAAGHLVAGFLAPASSPVLAIGSTVIDLTPTPVKEWAIATFGTNDKPILQGSVLVVTLVLAAVAGLLARRRMPLAVGCHRAAHRAGRCRCAAAPAARPLDALPALAAMAVGVAHPRLAHAPRRQRPGDADARARPRGPRRRQPPRVRRRRGSASRALSVLAGRRVASSQRAPQAVTEIVPARAADPRRPLPDRARDEGPRHLAAAHPDRRLLPRRHPASPCRCVDVDTWTLDHRRRRRPARSRSPSTTCWRCRSSSATSP